MLAIALVVAIALDIPAKAERMAANAVGQAGFTVSGYQIVGINRMDRKLVDAVVTDELDRAAEQAGTPRRRNRWSTSPPSAGACSLRLGQGCAGVAAPARYAGDRHRRTPPPALWQSQGQLALIDDGGVVLDRVPVDKMPDLPLLIGPGANAQARRIFGR